MCPTAEYDPVFSAVCQLFLISQDLLHFGIDEGEASKRFRIHGVNEPLVTLGEAGLLIQEFSVKVAAVILRFLQRDSSWQKGQLGDKQKSQG